MRKLFLIAIIAIISSTAFAQNEKWGIGLNIGYGSNSNLKKPSIGVKATYDISDLLTIAPTFNYYFQKKMTEGEVEAKINMWDINCDVHFNLLRKDNIKVYPLAGLSYLHSKVATEGYDGSDSEIGVNLGVGAQFAVAPRFAIAPEVKYQIISGLNQLVPSVSIMYKF